MKLFRFLRPVSSAPVARERLQILLEYERKLGSQVDLFSVLREEILGLIGRHVSFDPDKVQIKMDRGKSVSTLAVDIEIPNSRGASVMVSQTARPVAGRRRKRAVSEIDQRVA